MKQYRKLIAQYMFNYLPGYANRKNYFIYSQSPVTDNYVVSTIGVFLAGGSCVTSGIGSY